MNAEPGTETIYPSWGALRWLFLFRLLMVVGLVLAFSPAATDPALARSNTQLAWNVLVVYALLVLISGAGLSLRWPPRINQVQLAIFVDILAYTALMHTAGGVTSGLGILLAVAVAAGALMLEGRLSLLFAALASLAVISEQIYSTMLGGSRAISFTQAGLLGLLFFTVALLAHVLYRRVRSAEALAARRQVDIDDLSQLNEFIIQSIGTGILVADGAQRLRRINAAALNLLGARHVKPGITLQNLSAELGRWLASQIRTTAPREGRLAIANREVWVSLKRLGQDCANGVVIYLRDGQEAEREAQQIKLASLGTLTASIAHNIRNPLSAISHAGQLLSEGPTLSDEDRHLLDIVQRNSARIEETVRSVLQLSRGSQIEPRPIELAAWTLAFAEDFREQHGLDETGLHVLIEAPPLDIETDPRHLHQILANLCENALVHGGRPDEAAHIQLRLGRRAAPDGIYLEVQDAGPGIDPTTVRDIFNPFFTTKSQGTGLGLYIARELAESNGIRLTYAAARPHGSRFILTFG
ncbi:sensor histidine kinase [Allochromatium palmeri]|uniref:histidine kinase n=1 Tax=Allochromatium palmeri TaxID=231048 RepID=A0A6N8EGP2_9GAMM|nr:ATP-binding protein [Allochromatium palmeri]MTW21647.1 two-component sensor histidine kinase [Allochromatium palmeri]